MNLWALALPLVFQAALPPLTGRVVDRAGILSSEEVANLASRLERIENETSVQFVVATIPSLEGEPIEDYSIRLAEEWKIGQRGLDNGAIIIVVPSERRIRIEVGYGLEAVIPDGLAGRIIRERVAPAFQAGSYYQGLLSAIEGLELAARREYPDAPERPREPSPGGVSIGALLVTYLVVGILGNAIGILLGILAGALVFPLVGGGIAAALGVWSLLVGGLLGLFSVLLLRSMGSSGNWTSPRGRPGGFGGGGFGGFGGGGGGGFSGGGGRFGGGGASGSW